MSKRLRSQLDCEDASDRNNDVEQIYSENVPATLTESCIAFISVHLHLVDSFLNFPDIIAEKIFKAAYDKNIFTEENQRLSVSLKCFTEAYDESVLESLCLAHKHLVLNKYFDTLCLFKSLTKLDISNCGLGDNHDMLYQLSTLQSLHTLNISSNSLTDEGMRKFTAPLRMFKQTWQHLKHCDFSDNGLTGRSLQYMLCLSKVEILNLSGNKIKCYTSLQSVGLYLAFNAKDLCEDVFNIQTVGWAAPVVEHWCQKQKLPSAAVHKSRNSFYKKAALPTSQASLTQSSSVYTDVLVSEERYPLLIKENPGSNKASKCKTKHLLKHVNDANDDYESEQDDNYLMNLYGGFKRSSDTVASLSDVLV